MLETLGGPMVCARAVELFGGDVILYTCEVGTTSGTACRGERRGKSDGTPDGWHFVNTSVRDGSAAYSHPHVAVRIIPE